MRTGLNDVDDLREQARQRERETLAQALAEYGFSIGKAAFALGISYSSLRARLKKFPDLWGRRRRKRGAPVGSRKRGLSAPDTE